MTSPTPRRRNAVRESFQAQFKGSQFADVKRKAIEELHAVSGLLDAKAPDEAAAFKSWLWSVAQKSAEAGKEGGFLGFGGVAVSDAEKATLAEIAHSARQPGGCRRGPRGDLALRQTAGGIGGGRPQRRPPRSADGNERRVIAPDRTPARADPRPVTTQDDEQRHRERRDRGERRSCRPGLRTNRGRRRPRSAPDRSRPAATSERATEGEGALTSLKPTSAAAASGPPRPRSPGRRRTASPRRTAGRSAAGRAAGPRASRPAGHRDARQAGHVHRHREDVVQVHLHRIAASPSRRCRRRRTASPASGSTSTPARTPPRSRA